MAAKGAKSMADGLTALLSQIAPLKLAPDADLDWLGQLEAMILSKAKGAQQQGPTGSPFSMAGQGSAQTFAPPGGVAGLMQGPATTNPDELRRVLAGMQ